MTQTVAYKHALLVVLSYKGRRMNNGVCMESNMRFCFLDDRIYALC